MTPNKNYFDIHSLILKGIGDVREYKLPVGTVFIRPLSEIEMEECELVMFNTLKDQATLDFAFGLTPDKLKDMNDNGIPDDVNVFEFIKANNEFLYNVAYKAMKDFTDEFSIEDMKKIPGIKELGKEVQRISGYTPEALDQVADFREE